MENFNDLINFEDYQEPSIVNGPEIEIPQNTQTDNQETDPVQNNDLFGNEHKNDDNLLFDLLKEKGFVNPNEIKIVNEAGEEETVSFNDLSNEEKMQILTTPDYELSDEELNTINFLRQNNTTLEDVVKYREKMAIEKASNSKNTNFIVDQATDEQLMLADLKFKYPSFTEEELEEELEKELDSPLFDKKIQVLREQYKQVEEQDKEEQQRKAELQAQEEYKNVSTALSEVAQNVDDMHGLILDDQDKSDVLRFLLEKDVNGQSEFYKLLNDPVSLFNLAWFAVKGDEAFDIMHQYYKKEIETARHGNKQTLKPKPSGSSVVRKKSTYTTSTDDKYDLRDYFN